MSTVDVSTEAQLEPGEAVLMDVLRLILRDRADEVPGRVRKLVTTQAGRRKARFSEPGRAAIALLFAEEAARPSEAHRSGATLRRISAAQGPAGEPPAAVLAALPVLAPADAAAIDDVVREHHERDRLLASGLHATRTILLSGPPGVGKSMTMQSIAARIGRPLIRLEPTDVIGSLLGESGRSLAAVFADAHREGAVLGLDEIDALAKRRDDLYDVGEFKRFVTTLLLELDRWSGEAPLVAATNHLDLLDPALERRFEAHIRLAPPDEQSRRMILRQVLDGLALAPKPGSLDALVAVTVGATGADLTALVHRAARRSLLDDEPLDRALLMAGAPRGAKQGRRARELFASAARDSAGLSTRAIGELLDCSHTAAGRLARAGTTNA
jgi:SpoVK/Ycf46/Vps4 family AAA+-type ATPase